MISLRNIAVQYGNSAPIFSDITADIPAGSFHFLTGNSGAGKTTLLKLIFLALRPTRGSLSVFGTDVSALPRADRPAIRRKIGVIFQDFRLIDHLSVYENVTLPLRVAGQREPDYRANATELLNWVGLGDHLAALPHTLSGGEQQRAAIARAVISRPHLIVADEPTGNVDPDMGLRLMHLLDELNKTGTTVLVATHDQHIWENLGHPRLHLANGRMGLIQGANRGLDR